MVSDCLEGPFEDLSSDPHSDIECIYGDDRKKNVRDVTRELLTDYVALAPE